MPEAASSEELRLAGQTDIADLLQATLDEEGDTGVKQTRAAAPGLGGFSNRSDQTA